MNPQDHIEYLQNALLECINAIKFSSDDERTAKQILRIIGRYYHGDRAHFSHVVAHNIDIQHSYEWCADGVSSQLDFVKSLKSSDFKAHFQEFKHASFLLLDRKDQTDPNDERYRLLDHFHLERAIVVPLYVEHILEGFLSIGNPTQYLNESALLLTTASFLSLSAERALSKEERLISSLRKIFACMYIWDLTNMTYREIKTPSNMHNFFSTTGPLSQMIEVIRVNVDTDFQDALLEFTNPFTLTDRLKSLSCLKMEYLDKTIGWTRAKIIPVEDNHICGKINKVLLTLENIDLEKRKDVRMTYIAEHDSLTGILNRTAYLRITSELKLYRCPIAYVLLDVDKFKNINDTYGHPTGDLVLERVAKAMKHAERKTDYNFRMGGDEFCMILMNVDRDSTEALRAKLESIRAELLTPLYNIPGASISIGIVFSPRGFTDDLYHRADILLYKAKENRGMICIE